ASDREQRRDAIFKELLSKLNKEGTRNPQKGSRETNKDVVMLPWVNSVLGGLQTLSGLFPGTNLASLNQPIDRRRLSGFLYNISQYLQEMSSGLEEAPFDLDDEHLWEKVLYFFLQSEGSAAQSQWNGRVPPRPSIQVKDWFLSLRGSPHWDWLLGLLQSLTTLLQRQPHKPILTLLSQNWRTVSAVLEAAFQALISGTYGQASAGLQGFICALKGHTDCPFGVGWLQYVLRFLETHSWTPVVSLHPAGADAEHNRRGSGGRIKPFSLPPEVLKQDASLKNHFQDDVSATQDDPDSMRNEFLQALTRSSGGNLAQENLALVQSLDRLRMGLLHRVGSSVYGNLRKKVSQLTMAMLDDVNNVADAPQSSRRRQCSVDLRKLILGIRHNVTWNTQALGVSTQGIPSSLSFLSCPPSDENSFGQTPPHSPLKSSPSHQINPKGHHDQRNQHQPRSESDLQKEMEDSTTAEILEAACNESIPGLSGVSNFTVFLYCKLLEWENGSVSPTDGEMGLDLHVTCSDAAWYLAAAEEDFLWVHLCSEFFAYEFNNTVCANSTFWLHKAPQEGCLPQSGSRFVSAQAFRRCFLPNSSALISSLCGREHPDSHRSFPEGSWAAMYCFRQHNLSRVDATEEACEYNEWAVPTFFNVTMLEACWQTRGLREHMCLNASLYQQLLKSMPSLYDVCADLQAEVEDSKCLLQRFFDMLPAQYAFDTSQLCVNPAPLMLDVLHKLSVCQVEGGENQWFFVTLGYVLRVLDFMVGLSSGLDEGEGEARQGLGQAILLSSLLDNASWSAMQPEASTSVLHTVGVFLLREQNMSLKEDLLSCFSPVLWHLIEQDNNSSALRVLLQEYLQMPEDSIHTLVMAAEKDAVKRFLSHMHQSWDHLQVETSRASQKELQAMETMTAAFIHKFPRVTPELFVDLSQFLPFMSVSDIMSFPASVIVNDSLAAIRDHSSEMKSSQKKAFVKRLLQSSVVGDVPTWPPYFLSSILPLLPYLPVSRFQQLTSRQLTPLLELLGNSSLDGVRGRHVIRTIFTKNNNVTGDNISLGVLSCYLDPHDLQSFLSDSALWSTLHRQLVKCVSKGFISASGRLSYWLVPAMRTLNASSMAPAELTGLSALLPQLGASFLLSLSSQQLLEDMGQVAVGMTCDFLRFWSNCTDFAELLQYLTILPGNLRPALCIVEAVRNYPQLDVSTLSPWFSATLATMIDDLSNTSLRAVLDHVQAHFTDFLQLPHYKQTNIAEKADGSTLDFLGPLLPFLDRDSLSLVDKGALALRLEDMRSFCLPKEALRDISALLTQKDFMEPSKWQTGDIEHLGRLVFSLSTKEINSIPVKVLKKDTVEQVLLSQKRWEEPSCADIRGTFPSAWTSSQLSRMSQVDLKECVEVFSWDMSLSSEQRRALWVKLRQAFSPASELRTEEILALGSLVTEMTVRELHDISLSDLAVLAHLGMRAVILGVLRKRNLKIEELSAVDLATFGHLICGLDPSEIKRMNAYNLMAVRFLREMSLPCKEEQMEALTSRLSRPEAFGPVSAWGSEVFTEIGTLAGLEDIVLSALTREQVEGITIEAFVLLSPKKMAQVVFSAIQLSWLSAEQAWAITEDQWTELDNDQRLAVRLARYEGDVQFELR
uniref:Stereocilin-like n=1 Tax=Hippocampus comes TaxID=109280 RepID=A0A3Q3DSG2_HIPCM